MSGSNLDPCGPPRFRDSLLSRPADLDWSVLFAKRWWILGFVAILHLLVRILFLRAGVTIGQSEDWAGQFQVLLGVSLVLAAIFLAIRRTQATEAILMVQAFVLMVAAYPQGSHLGLLCLFTLVWTLELSLWLAWSAVWVALAANGFLLLLCFHPLPAFGERVPGMGMLDFSLLFLANCLVQLVCLSLRHYIIQTGLQSQEIGRLNQSLGSLLSANLDLQNYALEAGELATINECKRLTRDIHDGVGYTMINLKMMLEAATDLNAEGNERLGNLLEQAKEEIQNGLTESRRTLRMFREIERVESAGVHHIHRLVNSFSHATGLVVDIAYGNIPWSFGEDINHVIFRVLQESMTNAIRHGHASRIQINFWISDGRLRLSVDDDGVGSDVIKPGLGFIGMRERLEALGGGLTLGNGFAGFTVRVEIPWPGE